MGIPQWYERVNVGAIGDEARRKILEAVRDKYGFNEAFQRLGVSRASLYRYLTGESRVPDEVVRRALQLITEEEFRKAVSGAERLRALGLVKEDGTVDYDLALELLAYATRDEYLRQAILHFVASRFREDLRKMLGYSFGGVKLTWTDDFEHFLMERKRGKRVRDPETIAYYRSLFQQYLEGKELTEELVEQVAKSNNGWLRNVFRHYIQYLYLRRAVSPEAYGWIMSFVPSRQYPLTPRPYQVGEEDLRRTLEFLKEKHDLYYTIYRAMLESGARFEHVLRMLATWSPSERVAVEGLGLTTYRLVCFDDRGFCRYYCGLREGTKPCEWAYMSRETVEMVSEAAGREVNRSVVRRYAAKHGLVLPKMVRKVAWDVMVRSLGYEVAAFLQSRFGELPVSALRYQNLLGEADEKYPAYLAQLRALRLA